VVVSLMAVSGWIISGFAVCVAHLCVRPGTCIQGERNMAWVWKFVEWFWLSLDAKVRGEGRL
jgi:hypothetical protein